MLPSPYSGGDICGKTPAFRSKTSRVAKRDDFHSKLLFFVKNKGQWNAKSGPKVAEGMLLCEQNFRDVLSLNESVRAEIDKQFCTHTH